MENCVTSQQDDNMWLVKEVEQSCTETKFLLASELKSGASNSSHEASLPRCTHLKNN
jgi:hypothetical protein